MKTIVAMVGSFVLLLTNSFVANAAYRAPMAIDESFGNHGMGAIPPYDVTYFVDEMLGFAQVGDASNRGYIVFSLQHSAGNNRLAATRLDQDGHVDLTWGDYGSNIYAVPFPVSSTARIVANGDMVYFAALQFSSVTGDFQYYVLVVNGLSGAIASFVTTGPFNRPSGGTEQARSVDAITSGGPGGVIVAGRGATAFGAGNVIDLLTVYGTPATIDASMSYNVLPTASFRVNQISNALPTVIEMVGSSVGFATYTGFDTTTHRTTAFNRIPFRCPASATSSAADFITRDISLSGDVLVYGRMTCPGSTETYATLTRISSIESSPTIEWSTTIGREAASCDPSGPACSSVYATSFSPPAGGESHEARKMVIATSPSQELVYFDFSAGTDQASPAVGTEVNQGDIVVTPSSIKGAYLLYPHLVATARRTSTGQLGLARIAIDRVFADGIDTIP